MLLYKLTTEKGSQKFKMGHFLYKLLKSVRNGETIKNDLGLHSDFLQ